MSTGKIQFAKIVASPTEQSWSQVYSAGNLYAIVALTKKDTEEEATLNVIGKGIINNLEAEFFPLESKDLDSIKKALQNAIESTPDKVHLNLILMFIKEGVAYVFLVGKGEIILQRNSKKASIISQSDEKIAEKREVLAGSGPLKDNDILLLKTPEFDDIVSKDALNEAFATLSADEAAEILSPIVHGKEKGNASAVFLTYKAESTPTQPELDDATDLHSPQKSPEIASNEVAEEDSENKRSPLEKDSTPKTQETDNIIPAEHPKSSIETNYFPPHEPPSEDYAKKSSLKLPSMSLPKTKKKYLIISAILFFLLIGSIIFTTSQKENAQTKKEFEKVYSTAQKEVEEGESLQDLNASVAQDNFKNAQKLLEDNKNKFKEGSSERTQIDELLAKINKKVTGEEASAKVTAQAVDKEKSPLLALIIDKDAILATKNSDNDLFYLTSKKIIQVPASGEEKDIFQNDSDWTDPVGLGAFGSNVYVLDPKDGLMKFVAGTNGYGKTTYFKSGTNPDLAKSSGMAIDASIYILYSDGKIEQYTKGELDSFTLSGLKKPLKSPNAVFTTEEMDNLYILDKGNSRIVKIDKSGNYKSEYNVSLLKNATHLDVSETDNKAFFLVKNKVYEISLK